MCGIAGIVVQDAVRHRPALENMVSSLRHRGPDGNGTRYFGSCGLGHTRLAIVDPAGGQQPMCSADNSIAITFNGEIYGYRELRNTLSGYPFRTHSDTEVLLAMYREYGTAMPERLPGMFAFAIWDDRSRQLVCARDRFGEKPLYYALADDGTLVFASEIKAILASGLITPEISRTAMLRYLRRGYPYPDGSIYRNIHAVPPGHCMTFSDGRIRLSRYWQLPPPAPPLSLEDAAGRCRELFTQAIRRQLVADVPVGAFLSGGLDSSTVVCTAARLNPDIRTFSFDFLGSHSEIEYARAVAAEQATELVELAADNVPVADLLLDMQAVYDEPFHDSSSIATFLLCKLTSQHTRVALTGDGADELFGGYSWYRSYPDGDRRDSMVFWKWNAARLAARAAAAIGHAGTARLQASSHRLMLQHNFPQVLDAHEYTMSLIKDPDLHDMGMQPVSPPDTMSARYPDNTVDAVMRNDIADYMPGDILVKTDRASMANSLELRAPFLDVDLAEFCIGLPASLKVSDPAGKRLLRAAFAQDWPASLRRRHKQGFGAPVERWLARDDIVALSDELLHNSRSALFGHCDFAGTGKFLRRATAMQKWQLLNLAAWFSQSTGAAS